MYPACWRSPSSRCLRTRGRSCSRVQASPEPRSVCSTGCGSPPGCQETKVTHRCGAHARPPYSVTFTHLFEADVGDFPQDTFQCVCPLPLPQRVLLGPDDVEVMRDVICRVVSGLALSFTLKPGVDVVWRTGVSCGFVEKFCTLWFIKIVLNINVKTLTLLPMFQVPTNTVIMSGSGFSECLFFIC